MQALTRLGRWHAGGAVGPMHKYYDPRLFDVLSEEEVRWQYAPKLWEGEYVDHGRAQQLRKEGRHVECVDARTAEELLTAGVDVRVVGSLGVGDAGGNEVVAAEVISRELFSKWLELREMRYGNAVARWWCCLPAAEEGDDSALKQGDDDAVADFYAAIERAVRQAVSYTHLRAHET